MLPMSSSALMTATLVWDPILLPNGPSPRFGVVSGVVDNFWIITHGNFTCCSPQKQIAIP